MECLVVIRSMSDLGLLASVALSAVSGTLVGFGAGLVPGFHMNNIAAGLCAYAGLALALFGSLASATGSDQAGLLTCCFVCAAMVSHLFSETITSAYVGIPAEDTVSVLPAHRLAKAGLGSVAVKVAADGCLAGLVLSLLVLFPLCAVMAPPVDLYGRLKSVMAFMVLAFSVVLVATEGFPSLKVARRVRDALRRMLAGASFFVLAGLIGVIVLMTNFYACAIPDMPWIDEPFVAKSSLLLPMFAGLFGIPGLLLSFGSRSVLDIASDAAVGKGFGPGLREAATALLGGVIVGWMPGMTSGSAVTLCSPAVSELSSRDDVHESLRFIWLYSAVSAAGAVFAVGALFVISRARSGTMDAVRYFVGGESPQGSWHESAPIMAAILLAMVMAAVISHFILLSCDSRLTRMRRALCSDRLAMISLVFVVSLSIGLTGTRGAMLLVACTALGLLPPLLGVRRIQLMGCLLVPVELLFLESL
ncbi:MAG TPA: tripartite tricarboxylate transporter permease [Thermoplasmata archaeon]|jgi:putative membrane protein